MNKLFNIEKFMDRLSWNLIKNRNKKSEYKKSWKD
jgi:hypothetical protein